MRLAGRSRRQYRRVENGSENGPASCLSRADRRLGWTAAGRSYGRFDVLLALTAQVPWREVVGTGRLTHPILRARGEAELARTGGFMRRYFLGICLLFAFGASVGYSHFCCYSTVRSYYTEPAGQACYAYLVEVVDWQEYWPMSGSPQHGHYWENGVYELVFGPFRVEGCTVGVRASEVNDE